MLRKSSKKFFFNFCDLISLIFSLVINSGVPAPAPLLPPFRVPVAPQGHQAGVRGSLQRPYSFTHGVIPEVAFSEALGAQLGTEYYFYYSILKFSR